MKTGPTAQPKVCKATSGVNLRQNEDMPTDLGESTGTATQRRGFPEKRQLMFRLAEIWTDRSTASNDDDDEQLGNTPGPHTLVPVPVLIASVLDAASATPTRSLARCGCGSLVLRHQLERKFTEQELRHTLELLNDIPRPLSPTLPPSPPASPAPPSQRRRISPETDRASTPSSQSTHTPPAAPPRRPALTPAELARIVPLYKERAKLFKRSGDGRKRGELRSSRLGLMELTDSVLHFAYVFWAEDRQRSHRGSVYSFVEVNTWRTLEGLVSACKVGWSKDTDPAARGVYGMLILLEALVLNKMTYFHMSQIREATKGLIIQPPAQNPSPSNLNVNPNAGATPNPNAAGTPNHPTPPSHVPSPAPTTSRSPVPPAQATQQQQQPPSHRPLPEFYLPNILKHSGQYIQSQLAIANAHALLNASFMHTHFPRTHQICMTTTLGALDEAVGDVGFVRLSDDGLEVDVEACVRGEGVWAWPILSGAGMAHLVGFGRSLLWEYGSTRGGYRGADGMNVDY